MNARTALEIASRLEALMPIAGKSAAEALRQQHAELGRLAMKNAAYASLTKAQDAELSLHRDRAAAYRAAVKNIDSEREANAILTAERDAAISAAVAAEREAHAAEIDRLKRERHHIYGLLARIHRDGGQYTAEHGVEKSCDDAEAQVVALLDTLSSFAAQAAAWRSLVEWICTATTTVDAQARQMYALDLVQGTAFDDWYDEAAGVDTGTNAPPETVLRVLRPYLLDKVHP